MTSEGLSPKDDKAVLRVLALALEVAAAAPTNQGAAADATVPWSTIHDLRGALEAMGADWLAYQAEYARAPRRRTAKAALRKRNAVKT